MILELEPSSNSNDDTNLSFYQLFSSCYERIKQRKTLEEVTHKIVQEIRHLTEFDRVMVDQFKEDNSGVVIAEDRLSELNSFLGLHFPDIDLPPECRQVYYQNFLQLIPNVNAQNVAIIPEKNPLTNKPLNLIPLSLRSFSPCDVEYLKNMGVSPALTLGLIKNNKLWGLIACHHYSPKYIS